MSRSIPRTIDRKGQHLSQCDVCGVMWLRSTLSRGRDGLLRCENDRPGRDSLTLAELTAARAAALAQRLGAQLPADGAVPDELPVRTPDEGFVPTDVSAVSAWLSVADATSDSNGVSSLPDLMNSNPAVQSVDARKPVVEMSGNGLPCMRFATNDVLSWPLIAANNGTAAWGVGLWIKPDVLAASGRVVAVRLGTGAASASKAVLITSAATPGAMGVQVVLPDGSSNGRTYVSTPFMSTTGFTFCTAEYDATAGTDASKLTITANGSVLSTTITTLGSGGALGDLATPTGNILIGNGVNDATAASPFNGVIGSNIYAFGSKMAGATQGLLTTEARVALMMYRNPTVVDPIPVPPRLPENGPYTGPTRRLTVADVYNNEIPTYGDPYTAVNKPGF